jgi:tRNA-specific 2-thiouridylase
VCDLLGIAHYALNYRDLFEREVVKPYAREYAAGRTPSPCIDCNDRLKFSDLLAKVSAQGAEYLATGHYARIASDSNGLPRLARAVDAAKDQSYFLYRLTRTQLEHVLFPVGELEKPQVRAIAERFGLHVAEKPESQDACFALHGPTEVLRAHAPRALAAGDIVDASGARLGTHGGIGRFTVGQRKGLGLPGGPWFVTSIDAENDRVIVGREADLTVARVVAEDIVWHGAGTADVRAQVRYRMAAVPAVATVDGDRLVVAFETPVRAVAPGQAVVCYEGDVVVGGGVIACTD